MKTFFISDYSIEDAIKGLDEWTHLSESVEEQKKQDEDIFDPDSLKKIKYFKLTIEEVPGA